MSRTLAREVAMLLASKHECSPLLNRKGAELVRDYERLLDEREIGATPNECGNPDCSTVAYGTGYTKCPRCGSAPIRRNEAGASS
jgi:hypothetical protein